MAYCGDSCQGKPSASLNWFKISELVLENGDWASNGITARPGHDRSFKIPSDQHPGESISHSLIYYQSLAKMSATIWSDTRSSPCMVLAHLRCIQSASKLDFQVPVPPYRLTRSSSRRLTTSMTISRLTISTMRQRIIASSCLPDHQLTKEVLVEQQSPPRLAVMPPR
jgi:hypothetical protein